MKKHIEVVAGAIKYEDKILCMERNKGKYDYISYKFEFPGGKIEENETHHQTLTRELKEELDMTVEIKDFLIKVTHEYPDFILTMNVYNCEAKDPSFTLKEHNSFKWLEVQDLSGLDWAEADIPVVEKLISTCK